MRRRRQNFWMGGRLSLVATLAGMSAGWGGASAAQEVAPNGLTSRLTPRVERQPILGGVLPPLTSEAAPRTSADESLRGFLGDPELIALQAEALAANPELESLRLQVAAAWAKARSVDKPPDPSVTTTVFAHPIETAAGSQRANLSVAQMIPWFGRLRAQSQQACYEALALQQSLTAKRLAVVAAVRRSWIQLYIVDREIASNAAVQDLLESLSNTAAARITTEGGSQGDVLLATLELAKVQEQVFELHARRGAMQAQFNRTLFRPAETPIVSPRNLEAPSANWSHAELRDFAWNYQPLVAAAEIRAQATRWGVEVARLQDRPNFTASAGWYSIDDNRPASPIVNVGQDAWSVGVGVTIPLWRQRYLAARREATSRHFASHADADAVRTQVDAAIGTWLAAARSAERKVALYREAILPQTEQLLAADQQAFSLGVVDYERVLADVRAVLTAQVAAQRALGAYAEAVVSLSETIGGDEGLWAFPSGYETADELEWDEVQSAPFAGDE